MSTTADRPNQDPFLTTKKGQNNHVSSLPIERLPTQRADLDAFFIRGQRGCC